MKNGTNQTKWFIYKVHSEIGFEVRHLMIAQLINVEAAEKEK